LAYDLLEATDQSIKDLRKFMMIYGSYKYTNYGSFMVFQVSRSFRRFYDVSTRGKYMKSSKELVYLVGCAHPLTNVEYLYRIFREVDI